MKRLALPIVCLVCLAAGAVAPASAGAAFGLQPGAAGFEAVAEEGGAPYLLSGGHPYALRMHLALTTSEPEPGNVLPEGDLRDLRLQLPAGMLLNSLALPSCQVSDFRTPRSSPFEASASGENCPADTQVGTVTVDAAGAPRRFGLFNLAPTPGVQAQLGFAPYGEPIALASQLRVGADGRATFSLEARDFPQSVPISGLDIALWGTPWATSHNGERGNCLSELEPSFPWGKCSVALPASRQAYLTMPTDCDEALMATASVISWQGSASDSATYTPEQAGAPARPEDCGSLRFKPGVLAQLTDQHASSSSGFRVLASANADGLTEPGGRVGSPVRGIVLTLPQGVTINPSMGAGLGACSPAQLSAERSDSNQGEGCPNASKIGDFTLSSPLFSNPAQGAIYLATPHDNPFGSLLALYLVAREPGRGLLVSIAGELVPDPRSGTLAAHFDAPPRLPYTGLEMSFRTGQRAPLVTPAACGNAITEIELAPLAQGVPAVHSSAVSQIASGVAGGPCPVGTPPFSPKITAGSLNSNVGSYTPFYLRLSRGDAEQEITSYSMSLPKGITGKLAGVPFCSEGAIAAARANTGVGEATNPSCPKASEIGRSASGYGVGSALTYATGHFYMAGPYHGSALSIVSVNPATLGPFDLGTIVIRFAFAVDPTTAQLRIDAAGSDPIPHILDGVPLHLREIRVLMDRAQFTHNPSSCAASRVASTLTGSGARFDDSADDSATTATNYFQLLNCRTLGFRPRLGIRLRGSSRRGGFPSLRATFASRGAKDSNLKSIAVTVPHSEFLAQGHIRTVCTAVQFAADRCPGGSVYGKATAYTPLFDAPLRGDVYLRSSAHRLPDLVASLHSGAVRIVLDGKIEPAEGGIRVRFLDLPDAPVDRFVLTMLGGRRGLLVNSTDICASEPVATVKALGQNNGGAIFSSRLRSKCNTKGSKR